MFNRLKDERGFTLIELLVVVLIIGILAAVALPTFLGQRDKGFDADAKSNARNVQTLVESCGVDNAGDFTNCTTAAQLARPGRTVGTVPARWTSRAPARTPTSSRRRRSRSPARPTRRSCITKSIAAGSVKTATGGASW